MRNNHVNCGNKIFLSKMEKSKKVMFTGSVIAGAIMGVGSLETQALTNYSPLGSGAEVRTSLLDGAPSALNALEIKCGGKGDEKKSETGKMNEAKCGDNKKAEGKSTEHKCGEGKCGDKKDSTKAESKNTEHKCGEKKKDDKKKEGKSTEHKCGEGKCGN